MSFPKDWGTTKWTTKLRRAGAGERFGVKSEAVASANGGS